MVKPKKAPSAAFLAKRRNAQQRTRKQSKKKALKEKPNWAQALKRKYLAADGRPVPKWRPKNGTAKDSAAVGDKASATRRGGRDAAGGAPSAKRGRDIEWDEEGMPIAADDDAELREVQEEVDEEKVKKLNEKAPLERQIFLTGIPSTVDEKGLSSYFSRFGKLRKVFVVMDKTTKRAAGSAFIHYADDASATKAFDFAARQSRELAIVEKKELMEQEAAVSRHKQKSLLYSEKHGQKFTLKDPFVMLDNSRVSVHRVMSRMDAEEREGKMKKEKDDKKKRTKTGLEDPRNLFLLHEGEIVAGTPAAEGLPPKFLAMLQQSYQQRRDSLKNVNMFVSKTRLSIRNIPRHLKEPEVRKILLKEVRKFYKVNPSMLNKERFGKHGPLKNLTILTDANKVSKGFGFAEFIDHEAALWVLRRLNNNPTLFGQHHRLVIAFAVENANALQKLDRIREIRKMRLKTSDRSGDDD